MAIARSEGAGIALPSDTEILLTRMFDAPPRLVFAAWTERALLERWYACKEAGLTFPVCEIDLRPGGSYRFVTVDPAGNDFPIVGEYREIDRPHRLVYTQRFDKEPFKREEVLMTLTFEARGERTLFTQLQRYASKESRDGAVMRLQAGALGAFDRLADFVEQTSPIHQVVAS